MQYTAAWVYLFVLVSTFCDVQSLPKPALQSADPAANPAAASSESGPMSSTHAEERAMLGRGPLVDTTGKSSSAVEASGLSVQPERRSWLSAAAGLIPGSSHLMRHTGIVHDTTSEMDANHEGAAPHARHPLTLHEEGSRTSIIAAADLKIRRFGRKCDEQETGEASAALKAHHDEPSPEQQQQLAGREAASFQEASPGAAGTDDGPSSFFQMAAVSEKAAKRNQTDVASVSLSEEVASSATRSFQENNITLAATDSSAADAFVAASEETVAEESKMQMMEMAEVSAEVSELAHEVEVELEQIQRQRESLPVRISNVEAQPEAPFKATAPGSDREEERGTDSGSSSAWDVPLQSWVLGNTSGSGPAASAEEQDPDPEELMQEAEAALANGSYNTSGAAEWLAAGILENSTEASALDGVANAAATVVASGDAASELEPEASTPGGGANLIERANSHLESHPRPLQAPEDSMVPFEEMAMPHNMLDERVSVHDINRPPPPDKVSLTSSFKVMLGIACVGAILWACCIWLFYSNSALRAHVEALPVCPPSEVEKKLPSSGGYDCAIAKPTSSGHPVRLEGFVRVSTNSRALCAPLTKKESVLYSVVVTKQLHNGMHPLPVAFASAHVDFTLVLSGSPEVSVMVRGEDVSLFDMVDGRCIEQRTFAAAPEAWQDFVVTHRASAPSGEWQTSATLRTEHRPLEFQEYALHVGACVTVVGELHRAADGTLSLQPWQVMDRSGERGGGIERVTSVSAPWATSWECGGVEQQHAESSQSRAAQAWAGTGQGDMATRKVLASDDPQLLCSKATSASLRQRCLSCCMVWDVQQNGF
mmetsp:Transcript_9251/g.20669  ORF Transcript_9251/g.20669 Transcript_9251/m.20669 type:complete len:826 (-) Transcript_9251:143-2620(-)|eukprot:CAMPEP_0178391170 /NCGR_PEP_ID=MMETSP0689_2-20121128/11026_1 /TAXON_ID=160604 /ORGANISM="Amphidinium massartii, Strain CS-259" /LENGTH=825 /DNA_ID=CAMNT_0020011707 /DNA_START=79 /DNA_END=2556 /DNA_ORIENTATION=-